MNRINRKSSFRRVLLMGVSAIFATTALAGPVQADHLRQGLGMLLGGIVGGSIGSTIGKGRDRRVAIGVGTALGALYGREVAAHHGHRHRHVRHRHHSWRKPYHAHPRHSHAPVVVEYHSYRPVHQPVAPVYVQPAPVYVAPPRAVERSITVSSTGAGSTLARYGPAAPITECKLLEGGLAPVYGCRDTNGDWRILR